MSIEFREFAKIARLSRPCTITEKIDGTNGCIYIGEDGTFLTGSRTRWITPEDDNFGFSRWAHLHKDELLTLGVGQHFGEWWGAKIQRGYGQETKRFSLFNVHKWGESRPACCDVVPTICEGVFTSELVQAAVDALRDGGSQAAQGFMKPEGVIVWHQAAGIYFKKTLDKDEEWKGKQK